MDDLKFLFENSDIYTSDETLAETELSNFDLSDSA